MSVWDGGGGCEGNIEAAEMPSCQEVAPGVFINGGIHLLADVPGSGEVLQPPCSNNSRKIG